MAKNIGKCIAVVLAAVLLAGCGLKPASRATPTPTTVVSEATPGPTTKAAPTPAPTPTPTPAPTEEEVYYAYLRDVLLPSMGSVSPGDYPAQQIGEASADLALDGIASAAVIDVDGDGSKELALAYFVSSANADTMSTVTNLRFGAYRMENRNPAPYADFDPFLTQSDPDSYNTPFLGAMGTFSGQELFLQEHNGTVYLVAVDRFAVDDADTVYRMYTFEPQGGMEAGEYYFGGHEGLYLVKDGKTLAGYSYMDEPLPDGAVELESEAEVEALLDAELANYGAQSSRSNLEIFQQGAPVGDDQPGRTNMTLIQGWGGDDPPMSYGPVNFRLYDLTDMRAKLPA